MCWVNLWVNIVNTIDGNVPECSFQHFKEFNEMSYNRQRPNEYSSYNLTYHILICNWSDTTLTVCVFKGQYFEYSIRSMQRVFFNTHSSLPYLLLCVLMNTYATREYNEKVNTTITTTVHTTIYVYGALAEGSILEYAVGELHVV